MFVHQAIRVEVEFVPCMYGPRTIFTLPEAVVVALRGVVSAETFPAESIARI